MSNKDDYFEDEEDGEVWGDKVNDDGGVWYKRSKKSSVWWLVNLDYDGMWIFSFDKKKKYYFYSEYPSKLTKEERETFAKNEPELAWMFGGEKKGDW